MPDEVRLIADGRNQPKGDYEVGKNRPPKHTQWKKGQSGNPKGRRRLSSDLAECNSEILAQTGYIQLNSKRIRATRAMTAMLRLHQMAMDGSLGAFREIIRMEQVKKDKGKTEGWTIIHSAPVFDEEENRYLKTFQENERLQERIKYLEGRLNPEPDQ